MTNKEFAEILSTAKSFYPREKFVESKEAFDNWFSIFKDMDYEKTHQALCEYARESEFAPTIAGICKHYDAIEAADRKFEREITDRFDCLARSFGRPEGNEARELFDDLIKSDDRKKMMQKANWLRSAGWRESAANPDMTLVQFLKGVIK